MPIHALKDPLGYAAMTALIQAGIYTAKAARNLTAAEAIEAAAGLGLIAGEVAPATAAATAAAAGYFAYRGGKYAYEGAKEEYNWLFGKKKKKKATSPSQSSAQRMSKRGRSPRDDYEREIREEDQRLRKRLRAASGKMRIAVAKRSKKQRKSRKPVKPGMMTKRHYDDHGTVTRAHSLWFGVEDSGSYERLFDIMGEAVTRAILSKAKVYPKLYDQPLSDFFAGSGGIGNVLTLGFKNVAGTGADDLLNVTVNNVESLTFKTLSSAVTNYLQSYAQHVDTVNGDAKYYLDSFILSNSDAGDRLAYDLNMADAVITVMAKGKVKLQNITTNTAGGDDLDVVGTNPINGKRYTFNDQRARLVSQLQEFGATKYDKFEATHHDKGVVALDALGADDPLAHPPVAKNVWSNCIGVAPVYIKAGGMSHHYQTFTCKRTIRQFIEDIAKRSAGFTRSPFGKMTWWCFERTYKQNGTGANADDISIGFNRELSMYAMCSIKRDRTMLKHYDNEDIGAL